jgi:hypothetical protein
VDDLDKLQNKKRFCKEYTTISYAVDVFVERECSQPHSHVCLPPTEIKECGMTLQYNYHDRYTADSIISTPASKVLELLGIRLKSMTLNSILELVTGSADQVEELPLADNDVAYTSKDLSDLRVLVEGILSIECHNASSTPCLHQVFKSINSFKNNGYDDDVEDIIDEWQMKGTFTENARAQFNKQRRANVKRFDQNAGFLYNLIKEHNKPYFDEHFGKKTEQPTTPRDEFKTSPYTWQTYNNSSKDYDTMTSHIDHLVLCIACLDDGDYILKYDNSVTGWEYKHFTARAFQEAINRKVVVETTEDEREQMRRQKKRVNDHKDYPLKLIIQSSVFQERVSKWKAFKPITQEADELQAFRFPYIPTNFKPLDMNEWYNVMLKRVKHRRPFDDLIATIQLAILQPNIHASKIFAKYSASGNDGKGYIDSCLSCIFDGYRMINLKIADIESPFNSYMTNFYNAVDEAQNENYTTHRFDETLKNYTNPEIVITRKGKDQITLPNHTIMNVNSNDKTIYGITRGDKALLSRMVFIELLSIKDSYEQFYLWSQNEYNPSTPEFKRSMYLWLRDEFQAPADYTPNRYIDHAEKDEYVTSANMTKKNSVEMWMSNAYDQFTQYKMSGTTYKKAVTNELYEAYKNSKPHSVFTIDSFTKQMISMGFEQKLTHNRKVLRIEAKAFDELYKVLNDGIEIDDCEEDCGV